MAGVFSNLQKNKTKKSSGGVFSDLAEQSSKGVFADKSKGDTTQVSSKPITAGEMFSDLTVTDKTPVKKDLVALQKMKPKAPTLNTNVYQPPKELVSGVLGFVDTGTMGLRQNPELNKRVAIPEEKKIIEENPKSYMTGGLLGALLPGVATEKAAGALIKGTTIGAKLGRGAVAGGGYGLIDSLNREQDTNTVIKNTAIGAGLGVVGEGLVHGLSKFIKKPVEMPITNTFDENKLYFDNLKKYNGFKNSITKEPLALPSGETLALPEPAIQMPPKSIGVKTLENKLFAPKTEPNLYAKTLEKSYSYKTPKDIAQENLDNAIEKIQNYFGTNDLRASEIPLIKSELGIDLDSLVNDLDRASNTTLQDINNLSKLKRVSGASSNNAYNILNKIKNEPPKASILDGLNPSNNTNLLEKIRLENEAKQNMQEFSKPKLPIKNPIELNPKYAKETPFKAYPNELGNKPTHIPKEPIKQPIIKDKSQKINKIGDWKVPEYDPNKPLGESKVNFVSTNAKEPFGIQKIKNILSKTYTEGVDRNYPIYRNVTSKVKDLKGSENPTVLASNATQSNGIVDTILNDALVDSKGNKISNSYADVIKDLKPQEEEILNRLLGHRHNIDRFNEGKPVFPDFSPEMSAAKVSEYEKQYPHLKQIADNYVKWYQNFMDTWGVKEGLVSKENYQMLKDKYKNYIPTNRSFDELEKANQFNKTNNGFVNKGNQIKKATGSERDIINPLETTIGNVNKIVKAAKNNEVAQSILNLAEKHPDIFDNILEVIPNKKGAIEDINNTLSNEGIEGLTDKLTEQFNRALDSNDKGSNIITVMRNGEPIQIKIKNKELLKNLTSMGEGNGLSRAEMFEKGARWLTAPFKAVTTGKNPFFILKQVFVDTPTSYINSVEKNPFKFLGDYFSAYKDIMGNSSEFQRYKSLGGLHSTYQMNNLANAKASLNIKDNILKRIGKKYDEIASSTETAPRYAEYKRVLNKTGDTNQALYSASENTVNFSRSGHTGKTVDAFVPYLNPAIQGMDKLVRQFGTKPVQSIVKAVVVATIPAVYNELANKDNPYYQKLDNRTKDTYYNIPNVFGEKDVQGNPMTFIKIPKSREIGALFGAGFQRIVREFAEGKEESWKGYGNTLKNNFAPPTDTIFAPLNNLKGNKDFANRDIIPKYMIDDQRSPYLQYDEKTTSIAKKIGELANISPMQIDYLFKSYTGMIYKIAAPLLTDNGKMSNIIKSNYISDPAYNNDMMTDFYDKLDTLKNKASDKNILEKIPSKKVTQEEALFNKMNKARLEISKINKQIKATNDENKIKDLRRKVLDIVQKNIQ